MGNRRWSLIARLGLVGLLGLAVVPMSIAERRNGPEIARAATAAAQAAAADGDIATAERQFRDALRHDPRHVQALYGLGVIEQERGDAVGSAAKFRAAIAADPAFAEPMRNLARVLAARPAGEEEAIDWYRRYLDLRPDDAATHLAFGLLLRRTGARAEGDAEVRRALELDPRLEDPG